MIQIRALFFATYREALGSRETSLTLPRGARVSDLVAALRDQGPPFDRLPSDPAVAVNQSYAAGDPELASGDEVAFIPPIAGG